MNDQKITPLAFFRIFFFFEQLKKKFISFLFQLNTNIKSFASLSDTSYYDCLAESCLMTNKSCLHKIKTKRYEINPRYFIGNTNKGSTRKK